MDRRAFLAAGVAAGMAAACRCALGQERLTSRPACAKCGGDGEIACEQCKGKWRNVTVLVKCERKGGVGCDGRGYRDCFKCKGEGHVPCPKCGGDGIIIVRETKGPIVTREWEEPCPECGPNGRAAQAGRRLAPPPAGRGMSPTARRWITPGTGRVFCPKCRPLWQCTACERVFEHEPEYCPCTDPKGWEGTGKTTIVEMRGKIVCPRCKGTGEREERVAKCPYCREGVQKCRACGGTGR